MQRWENMKSFLSTVFLIFLLCSEGVVESRKLRRESGRRKKNLASKNANKTKIYYRKDFKWLYPKIGVNWKTIFDLSKKPTNRIKCAIFCRSGYHLQILPSGVVRGTVNQGSKYTRFEMQSFGPSLVKIKSVATGRYLAMRRDGALKTTRHIRSRETIFKETHEMNAFHSYASHRYFSRDPHDMLVGIKRNGHIKRATKTRHGQTATQFLVIKAK